MNFARNFVKNGFFFQNNFLENSLICHKNKSASHCLTELFPIYPNNHWTIRRPDDHIVVLSSNRIKLKIDRFLDLFDNEYFHVVFQTMRTLFVIEGSVCL